MTIQDDIGGFLVPEITSRNREGRLASIYRWLGLRLRSKSLYRRGTETFNIREAIVERLAAAREGSTVEQEALDQILGGDQ